MKFGNSIRKILFGIVLLGLSCAIWQNYVPIFNIKKLDGSIKEDEHVPLNWKNWFSADYQLYVEKHIVLNNALSPFFIRVNNQIDYSLFDQLHISGGILGKENYLFDQEYINAYHGKDFVGEDVLRKYVEKIKFVQDTLRKLNKEFIYIQAPGKASYFPEYLPDSMSRKEADLSNYNRLSKLLIEYKINHIDFKPFFLKSKSTSEYPLFTQTGIHWSKYATGIVMDSINNFIEGTMKLNLPEVYWDEVELDYAKHDDADMEVVLNLLFKLSPTKYAYPKLKFEARENKDVPVVMMIGDSYMGNLYWGHFYESFDLKSQFWYYNTSVYSPGFSGKVHKYQLDEMECLKKSDIIILGSNEPNIKGVSWGFIDNAYNYFHNGNQVDLKRKDFMRRVDSCKAVIGEDELYKAEDLAKEQHISIDSAKTVLSIWKLEGE